MGLVLSILGLTAHAELDVFGLGTGRNGALSVTTACITINSYAPITVPLATGDLFVPFGTIRGSSAGFATGDLVIIWQPTGFTPAPASGVSGPLNMSAYATGQWEFARVSSTTSNALSLTAL